MRSSSRSRQWSCGDFSVHWTVRGAHRAGSPVTHARAMLRTPPTTLSPLRDGIGGAYRSFFARTPAPLGSSGLTQWALNAESPTQGLGDTAGCHRRHPLNQGRHPEAVTSSVSRSRSMVSAHEKSDTEGSGLFLLRLRRTAGTSAMNSAHENSVCCASSSGPLDAGT